MSTSTARPPVARPGESVDVVALLAEAERLARALSRTCGEILAEVREAPPTGTALRTQNVAADELVVGDRAVPAERSFWGRGKDPFRHFRLIDSTGRCGEGQVVLGWDGDDHLVAADWPFLRVASGRTTRVDADGTESAAYQWDTAGRSGEVGR